MSESISVTRWRPARVRRFIFTVILYGVFGIGAVGVVLLAVLPGVLVSWDSKRRRDRIRWINHKSFKYFMQCGIALGVFDVTFHNTELLDQPGQLIIANHPSLLDVVILIGWVPRVNCVVKSKLLRNPFLAMNVYFADYIRNDAREKSLAACVDALKQGETLIVFPEGTRTNRQEDYKFTRGAAYLMLLADCPVRLVHISCEPAALSKTDPWYLTPERKITYHLNVIPELNMTRIRDSDKIRLPLKARRLTKWLTDYYQLADQHGTQSKAAKDIDVNRVLEKGHNLQ